MAEVDLVSLVAASPGVAEVASFLAGGRRVVAVGASTSGAALTAAAITRLTDRHTLLIVPHIDDGDEALDELDAAGIPAVLLPALEAPSGEAELSVELFAQRMSAVARTLELAQPESRRSVVIAPFAALMQLVPPPARLASLMRLVSVGDRVKLNDLVLWLAEAGYKRIEAVEEPGDFALRGGILDIFPPGGSLGGSTRETSSGTPVRLDFFGDEIEKIAEIDLESMGSDRSVKTVMLYAADANRGQALSVSDGVNFLELVPRGAIACIAETQEVVEQGRGYFERTLESRAIVGPPAVLKLVELRFHAVVELNHFSAGSVGADARVDVSLAPLPAFAKDAGEAVQELAGMAGDGSRVIVCCQNQGERDRLSELLAPYDAHTRVGASVGYLHRGFSLPNAPGDAAARTCLVPYHELLNRFTVRRRLGARTSGGVDGSGARLKASRAMDTFLDFAAGDYVVHIDHGIARFAGLTVMKPREVPAYQKLSGGVLGKREVEPEEYITLEFASQSKLHVPATQIDKVQKYVGGYAGKPPLSVMGGVKWKNQKERVTESVRDLAGELIRVRAAREHVPGVRYPNDTTWQREFEEEFPYEETQDQLAALGEIKKDMQSPRPMDRLICGDVGFGKTELAIRAAFKACEYGKQVAVVVPTTVLAEQHERTFRDRFAGYPFKVESLSRFKTDKEVKAILHSLRHGGVDLVIGTHRLFSQDVHFSDLGLVVIDEEQRFGVEHKEALLRLRLTVDVLTLSATPIPRTLHMAMLGIRDISSLTTAPLDRRAIVTEVFPYNERRIQQAIARELAREGQVYFVHNRVHDIISVTDNIRKLCPEGTRVVYGHGQMAPHDLEAVMLKFMRRGADVLVATTIIEAGIDIPSANTMLINDADRFGLADLHQLRGRVGRSKHRAYCYLLLDPEKAVKEVAQKRLKAIEQFSMLGAGFKIAMRDLEIRGAGNILGPEQSGHIAAVGYEMYCHLLEKSVNDLKNDKRPEPPSATALEIGIAGLIPKAYIPSEPRRLEAYRRLSGAANYAQLDQLHIDMIDAYGGTPRQTQRLFELAQIRIALANLGVRTCTIRDRDIIFFATDPVAIAGQLHGTQPGAHTTAIIRTLPPNEETGTKLSEVYFRPPEGSFEPDTLLAVLRRRLGVPVSDAAQRAAASAPARLPAGGVPVAKPPPATKVLPAAPVTPAKKAGGQPAQITAASPPILPHERSAIRFDMLPDKKRHKGGLS